MVEGHAGVAVVTGFGHEIDPMTDVVGRTAVYLNGQLVGAYTSLDESEERGDRDPAIVTLLGLSRQLAQAHAVPWVTWKAHAQWARPYDGEPPQTLATYEEQVLDFYRSVTWNDAIVDVSVIVLDTSSTVFPIRERGVLEQVELIYSFSGGDLSDFRQWYDRWSGKCKTFLEDHEALLAKVCALEFRGRLDSPECKAVQATLRDLWREALLEVWEAEKLLDGLAKAGKELDCKV